MYQGIEEKLPELSHITTPLTLFSSSYHQEKVKSMELI